MTLHGASSPTTTRKSQSSSLWLRAKDSSRLTESASRFNPGTGFGLTPKPNMPSSTSHRKTWSWFALARQRSRWRTSTIVANAIYIPALLHGSCGDFFKEHFVRTSHARICISPKKNLKLSVRPARTGFRSSYFKNTPPVG